MSGLDNRICKSLDKNKDEKVNGILMKLKKLKISDSIQEFNKHIEEEKKNHIAEFKRNILNSFFTMKLTKSKKLPFL